VELILLCVSLRISVISALNIYSYAEITEIRRDRWEDFKSHLVIPRRTPRNHEPNFVFGPEFNQVSLERLLLLSP